MSPRTRRTPRALHLLAASAFTSVLVGIGAPSHAAPEGGASPDTPGTSSSVTPKTLAPGGRITFTIKGFPGGETIYVKIDDGNNCADTTQGGCVYHQQKIPSSGTVTGSFTLPKSISEGKHWLRFLASKQIFNAAGEFQGIEGYTLRKGSDFTVAKASAAKATTGGAATTTGPVTEAQPSAQVTQDTATLSLGATTPSTSAGASAGASTVPVSAPVAAPAPVTTVQTISTPRPIPVIGIIVLGGAIALAAATLGWVVARTGRRTS